MTNFMTAEGLPAEDLLAPTTEGGPDLFETATIDRQTELSDHAGALHVIDRLVETQPGRFAVIFLDMDGLKHVNDTQGHAAGDEAIATIAEVLRNNTRQETDPGDPLLQQDAIIDGFAAHLSGDEFLVVLRDVETQDDVDMIAARLVRNLAAVGIQMSVGGLMHQSGQTTAELLKTADALMYEQKKAHHAQQQLVERGMLNPEVRDKLETVVRYLGELSITVEDLYRLYGNRDR